LAAIAVCQINVSFNFVLFEFIIIWLPQNNLLLMQNRTNLTKHVNQMQILGKLKLSKIMRQICIADLKLHSL